MNISKTRDVKTPTRGTEFSAGIDFYIPNDIETGNLNNHLFIAPGESIVIDSGIKIDLESLRDEVMTAFFGKHYNECLSKNSLSKIGVDLIFVDKSGIASKKSLLIVAKLIDQDYQGTVNIDLHNISNKNVILEPGQKIAQLKPELTFFPEIKVVDEDKLFDKATKRREGKFGSTGIK